MNQTTPIYIRSLPDIDYVLRIRAPKSARWLIVVHGINRDVDGLLRWFGHQVDLAHINLIAPLFDTRRFPDYQRLGRAGLGQRADQALLAILKDVRNLGFDCPAQPPLFGFSGGAQFAHRFTLSHGAHVGAVICASAGWYTPLSPEHTYPYGLRSSKRLPDLTFSAPALLNTPSLTLIGEQDTETDDSVRSHPKIDPYQGHTRLERARWWHQHLRDGAREGGLHTRHLLQTLPNCDHNFRTCAHNGEVAARVIAFCELTLPMLFDDHYQETTA